MTTIKKQRSFLFLTCGMLILLALGAVALVASMPALSKSAVERLAHKHLGLNIDIGALDIHPESQSVVIRDIRIDNPGGYKKGPALAIGMININSHLVHKNQLVVEDVSVSDVVVQVEVDNDRTNLSDLKKEMTGHKTADNSARVIIDHIVFTGVKIEPATVTDAIARDLSPLVLPEIHLRGIGEGEQGVAVQEAVLQILTHVINVSLRAAADEGYLDSLTPDQQMAIGARLSLKDRLVEDAKSLMNRAPSDIERAKKTVKKTFRLNE